MKCVIDYDSMYQQTKHWYIKSIYYIDPLLPGISREQNFFSILHKYLDNKIFIQYRTEIFHITIAYFKYKIQIIHI